MKPFLFVVFLASAAFAQNCYFTDGNTTNCPTDIAQSPDINAFAVATVSSMDAMRVEMAPLPQPFILQGAEFIPGAAGYSNADPHNCYVSSTCIFANVTNGEHFIASSLHGVYTTVDWNIDPLPFTQAAEYSGAATPPQPAWETYLLSVYDAWAEYLVGQGFTIRLSPGPLGNTLTACGLTYGSVTLAQMETCLNPMYVAIIEHWNNLGTPVAPADFTGIHEPAGGYWPLIFGTGPWQTAANVSAFEISYAAAVHGATGGSGINIGAGFGKADIPTYTNYFIAHNSASAAYLGLDCYPDKDPSTTGTLFNTVFAPVCPAVHAAGMDCKANESAQPSHVPASAPSGSQQYAYEGCGWVNWQLWGFNDQWAHLITKWAAANQFDYWSQYQPQPNWAPTSNSANANCYDNSLTAYTALLLQGSVGTSLTGHQIYSAGLWPGVSFQGSGTLSGSGASQ